MTFDLINYSRIVVLVTADGITYVQINSNGIKQFVYIVCCVNHILLAGLGCSGIPDMVSQVKL